MPTNRRILPALTRHPVGARHRPPLIGQGILRSAVGRQERAVRGVQLCHVCGVISLNLLGYDPSGGGWGEMEGGGDGENVIMGGDG